MLFKVMILGEIIYEIRDVREEESFKDLKYFVVYRSERWELVKVIMEELLEM